MACHKREAEGEDTDKNKKVEEEQAEEEKRGGTLV